MNTENAAEASSHSVTPTAAPGVIHRNARCFHVRSHEIEKREDEQRADESCRPPGRSATPWRHQDRTGSRTTPTPPNINTTVARTSARSTTVGARSVSLRRTKLRPWCSSNRFISSDAVDGHRIKPAWPAS
jgi:hypothetical protein